MTEDTHIQLGRREHVTHRRDGMRYLYSPAVAPIKARHSALRHLVSTFFEDSPLATAALLEMSDAKLSPAERKQLSGAILGLASCIAQLLRGKSADSRRLVLSAAVVGVLLAAVAFPLMPRLNVPKPRWLPPTVEDSAVAIPVLPVQRAARAIAHFSTQVPAPPPA